MIAGRSYEPPTRRFDPSKHSTEGLRVWCRQHAPDLRIGYALNAQGERRAFARWTWNGVEFDRGAGDEPELMRLVATAIAQLLGVPTQHDRGETARLEREIVETAQAGMTEQADALGLAFARRNESGLPRRVATRFER